MQKATDNEENAHYNDETLFADGIVEFHPEIYAALSNEEQRILQTYYLTGKSTPTNIFDYRSELLRQHPDINDKAQVVLQKILHMLNISKFQYTTQPSDGLDGN